MSNKYSFLSSPGTIVWLAFAVCCYLPLSFILSQLYALLFLDYEKNSFVWLFVAMYLVFLMLALVGIIGYRSTKLWGRIWAGCLFLLWIALFISLIHQIITGNAPFGPQFKPKPPVINWIRVIPNSIFVLILAAGIVVLASPRLNRKQGL